MHSDKDFTEEARGIQLPHRSPPTVLFLPAPQWELQLNTSCIFTLMGRIGYSPKLGLLNTLLG